MWEPNYTPTSCQEYQDNHVCEKSNYAGPSEQKHNKIIKRSNNNKNATKVKMKCNTHAEKDKNIKDERASGI